MTRRRTLAAWVAVTALVVVVFCTVELPDPVGWAAGYLKRWEIAFPLAVIVPVSLVLLWTTIKVSGPTERRLEGFKDPLAWLRALIWLYKTLLHPWHWASTTLKPVNATPTTERHAFRIALTQWVLYADFVTPVPDDEEQGEKEARRAIYWALARQPAFSSQRLTTAVADGMLDATPDAGLGSGFEPVLDLATRQAQKATYTSFGVWAFVLFALSRIGGFYATVVGVLWILAVSALLLLWFYTCMLQQQGYHPQNADDG